MGEQQRIGRLMKGYPQLLGEPAMTTIHTDAIGLEEDEVWIPVSDGELPAYRAKPAKTKKSPILLIIQEVFGCDDYLQDTCRRAAKAGFLAVAPELYVRQGEPGLARTREALFDIVTSVPDAQVMSDLDSAATWAAHDDGGDISRLACTGFCWGGRIVWMYAAHNPGLKAGVAWYGRLIGDSSANTPAYPVDVARQLHAPVLGLYGEKDEGIPLDTVERMKAVLAEAADPSQFIIYPSAPHAFHADYRPSFVRQDAEDGWQQMLDWFQQQDVLTP
ncbi:MAG: dienelactone hydrolase family protein [Pseudomonadota bacterium]